MATPKLMQTVLIEYVVAESASIEEIERGIERFVANIRRLDAGIRYASHRKRAPERAYVHIALIPSEEALARLQSAPFFEEFAALLRSACAEPPRVTWLDVVASTE